MIEHTTATKATTHTVGAGSDEIHYYVRGDLHAGTADRPVLLMIGSPMDATGFGSLAGRFEDRPVVTYDPRGSGHNLVGTGRLTPEQHADDLHRVIEDLGIGPVDVFASSGGAVNVLALLATHPDDVRRVVAHEPPTFVHLPDRDMAIAVCEDLRATYDSAGSGPAMAKFIALVMAEGELHADYLDRPAPDPAMFGMSADDDGSRTDPLMRNLPACNTYEPDLGALAALGDRLVIAAGVESWNQVAARGARSVAEALGRPVIEFPSNHGGFLDGEFGQQGDVDGFAEALHAALA
jgi:pimeloyl-ACP methyl ester carboxylesterase